VHEVLHVNFVLHCAGRIFENLSAEITLNYLAHRVFFCIFVVH